MTSAPDLQSILATLARFSQPDQNAQPAQQTTPAGQAQSRAIIDPATITTWQEGLRCVTKIAAQNKNFEMTIRKLICDQRAQEMKWYAERQTLKQTQARRQQSSAQARSILQSLTSGNLQSEQSNEVDAAAELRELDRKIYDNQKSFAEQVTIELKGIGVPFFGTLPAVIRPEDGPDDDPRVSKAELMLLQKRMIEHIEALYRD